MKSKELDLKSQMVSMIDAFSSNREEKMLNQLDGTFSSMSVAIGKTLETFKSESQPEMTLALNDRYTNVMFSVLGELSCFYSTLASIRSRLK